MINLGIGINELDDFLAEAREDARKSRNDNKRIYILDSKSGKILDRPLRNGGIGISNHDMVIDIKNGVADAKRQYKTNVQLVGLGLPADDTQILTNYSYSLPPFVLADSDFEFNESNSIIRSSVVYNSKLDITDSDGYLALGDCHVIGCEFSSKGKKAIELESKHSKFVKCVFNKTIQLLHGEYEECEFKVSVRLNSNSLRSSDVIFRKCNLNIISMDASRIKFYDCNLVFKRNRPRPGGTLYETATSNDSTYENTTITTNKYLRLVSLGTTADNVTFKNFNGYTEFLAKRPSNGEEPTFKNIRIEKFDDLGYVGGGDVYNVIDIGIIDNHDVIIQKPDSMPSEFPAQWVQSGGFGILDDESIQNSFPILKKEGSSELSEFLIKMMSAKFGISEDIIRKDGPYESVTDVELIDLRVSKISEMFKTSGWARTK